MSPADVVALANNDSMGGGNWFAMVLLFAIIFGNGGFGWGGNNNAVQADVNRGFDNQNLQAQTRDILSAVTDGTAQGIAATNQTFHDSLMANQGLYNELQRDVANVAMMAQQNQANQQQCCCETKMLVQQGNADLAAQIAQNEYNNAMRDAATNASFTAQIQGLKDAWYEDKIATLQQQVQGLNAAIGTQGIQSQLDAIQANMVTYPRGWSYSAGPSPFCGCGCGAI
jgi:hypothetical protein